MTYLPPQQQPQNSGKPEDHDAASDMDRLRAYSRQYEGEFNEAEAFPDKDDPADFWKSK